MHETSRSLRDVSQNPDTTFEASEFLQPLPPVNPHPHIAVKGESHMLFGLISSVLRSPSQNAHFTLNRRHGSILAGLLAISTLSAYAQFPRPIMERLAQSAPKPQPSIRPRQTVPDALTEIKRFDAAVASNATPSVLPFAGNITTFDPAGDGSSYGLLRQSDCSLSLLNANRNAVLSTTAKYEDTLHQQAQLTSTPDKYTGGCTDPILGRIAHFATIVGITSQGYYIGADGQLNGAESSISTYVYDPVSMKLISSASNATGENSGNISVGDLNGDGINDIVVPYDPAAYQNGAVSVLLGNADGTFQTAVSMAVPVSVYSVVLDDFNGDGIVDMVVTGTVGSTNVANVVFFPGKGDGTFGSPTTSTVTTAGTLVSADFNGDGKKDLIAGGYFLAGNGKGAFTQGAAIGPSNEDDYYLVPGDFNHDGKMDLAVNDGGQNVVLIYLGNGDGTFTQKATYAELYGAINIAATDLDGDGNLDLVIGSNGVGGYGPDENTGGDMQVLMGRGDGTFAGAPVLRSFTFGQEIANSYAVGDFTGNGNADLLGRTSTSSTTASFLVETNDGKGNLIPGPTTPLASTTEFNVVAADMNGDGKLDAVTLDAGGLTGTAGVVRVYLNQGSGAFAAPTSASLPIPPTSVAIADVNGDGKPDVIALCSVSAYGSNPPPGAPGIYLLLNNGDGTLASPTLLDGTTTTAQSIVIADLNGDGKPDLVVLNAGNSQVTPVVQGSLLVYLGNGNGAFASPVSYLPGTYNNGGLAVADVNGDGKPDILFNVQPADFSSPTLDVLPGKGDGTFGTPIITPLNTYPAGIALADFNGDGQLDVAEASCCGSTSSSLMLGNGDGTFQTPINFTLAFSSVAPVAIDINGDKAPDLLVAQSGFSDSTTNLVILPSLYAANLTAPTLLATKTALAVSAATANTNQSVTLTAQVAPQSGSGSPTGTITFMNGAATIGTATLNAATASFSGKLAAGSYAVTAVYSGDSTYAASTSAPVALTITAPAGSPVSTTTKLTASPTSAAAGTPVQLTATVSPQTGSGIPTGTVTFSDGATAIGTATLNGSATATFSISTLSTGSHSITAAYAGDANNAASVSAGVDITITSPATTGSFTLSLSPASASVTSGQSATTTLTLTPSGGFAASVTFACSGLPAHAGCSFSPSSVTPGSGPVTTTLTVTTGVQTAALSLPRPHSMPNTPLFALLGGGSLLGWWSRRRRGRKTGLPRHWPPTSLFLGIFLLSIAGAAALSGCGGSGHATPSGTDTISITAQSGSITQTQTFTLTVQ